MTITQFEDKIQEIKDNEDSIIYLKNALNKIYENGDSRIRININIRQKDIQYSFNEYIIIEMFKEELKKKREEYKNNIELLKESGLLIGTNKWLLED